MTATTAPTPSLSTTRTATLDNPGCVYDTNFPIVFTQRLDHWGRRWSRVDSRRKWTGDATGQAALKTYLRPKWNKRPADCGHSNPTSTSGGNLPASTAALALNIGFNAAGHGGTHTNLGSLTLCNLTAGTTINGWMLTAAQATALNGKTINNILTDANNAISGNGLASYYGTGTGGFSNLNELVQALNGAFDGCSVSAFATTYLCCAP